MVLQCRKCMGYKLHFILVTSFIKEKGFNGSLTFHIRCKKKKKKHPFAENVHLMHFQCRVEHYLQ